MHTNQQDIQKRGPTEARDLDVPIRFAGTIVHLQCCSHGEPFLQFSSGDSNFGFVSNV
jgi:hypothetical protein